MSAKPVPTLLSLCAVVDAHIRDAFPDTFPQRSLLASSAIRHIAANAGFETQAFFGEFQCLTFHKSGAYAQRRARKEHHWCGVGEFVVDLGLLHMGYEEEGFVDAPLLVWDAKHMMPDAAFGYVMNAMPPPGFEAEDPDFEPFVLRCLRAWQTVPDPRWIGPFLRGPKDLDRLVEKQDPWAIGAHRVIAQDRRTRRAGFGTSVPDVRWS